MQLTALIAQPCQPAHFSGLAKEGDVLRETGLKEKYEKASGRVFQTPRDCSREHRNGYRTRTLCKASKQLSFHSFICE